MILYFLSGIDYTDFIISVYKKHEIRIVCA